MLHRSFKLEKKNYLFFLETSLIHLGASLGVLGSKSKKKLRKLGHMPNSPYPIYLVGLYGRKKYGHWIVIFTCVPPQEIWTYF